MYCSPLIYNACFGTRCLERHFTPLSVDDEHQIAPRESAEAEGSEDTSNIGTGFELGRTAPVHASLLRRIEERVNGDRFLGKDGRPKALSRTMSARPGEHAPCQRVLLDCFRLRGEQP